MAGSTCHISRTSGANEQNRKSVARERMYGGPGEDVWWLRRGRMVARERTYGGPGEDVWWPGRGCMHGGPGEDVWWPGRACMVARDFIVLAAKHEVAMAQ